MKHDIMFAAFANLKRYLEKIRIVTILIFNEIKLAPQFFEDIKFVYDHDNIFQSIRNF